MKTMHIKQSTIWLKALFIFAVLAILLLAAPHQALAATKVATQTGVTVYSNDKATVDASNASQGYVMVKYTGGRDIRIKVQIIKSGGDTYSYDLNNKGNLESFPFSLGDGTYTVAVYENISDNKYSTAFTTSVTVSLANQFAPFLYSNQFVNYNAAPSVNAKAAELAAGKATEMEQLQAIYYYVIQNFTYDTAKAASVQPGYLPNLESVYNAKTGICFDYASLMAGMLRSQNIPCKLVIGYAGTVYHAWINVYITNVGWIDQAIYFDGTSWSLMDPTFASSSNSSAEVLKYIGNGANYSVKYTY